MMKLKVAFVLFFLTACTPVKQTKLDGEVLGLALNPPVLIPTKPAPVEAPKLTYKDGVYVLSETELNKIINFYGTSNAAIGERNKIIDALNQHNLKVRSAAKKVIQAQ